MRAPPSPRCLRARAAPPAASAPSTACDRSGGAPPSVRPGSPARRTRPTRRGTAASRRRTAGRRRASDCAADPSRCRARLRRSRTRPSPRPGVVCQEESGPADARHGRLGAPRRRSRGDAGIDRVAARREHVRAGCGGDGVTCCDRPAARAAIGDAHAHSVERPHRNGSAKRNPARLSQVGSSMCAPPSRPSMLPPRARSPCTSAASSARSAAPSSPCSSRSSSPRSTHPRPPSPPRSRRTSSRSPSSSSSRGRSASASAPRRVVRIAYLAYAAFCLLAAVAPGIEVFLVARALQGAANAFLTPLLLAGLAEITPPQRLGRAVGTFAAVQTAAIAFSPLAGGAGSRARLARRVHRPGGRRTPARDDPAAGAKRRRSPASPLRRRPDHPRRPALGSRLRRLRGRDRHRLPGRSARRRCLRSRAIRTRPPAGGLRRGGHDPRRSRRSGRRSVRTHTHLGARHRSPVP